MLVGTMDCSVMATAAAAVIIVILHCTVIVIAAAAAARGTRQFVVECIHFTKHSDQVAAATSTAAMHTCLSAEM